MDKSAQTHDTNRTSQRHFYTCGQTGKDHFTVRKDKDLLELRQTLSCHFVFKVLKWLPSILRQFFACNVLVCNARVHVHCASPCSFRASMFCGDVRSVGFLLNAQSIRVCGLWANRNCQTFAEYYLCDVTWTCHQNQLGQECPCCVKTRLEAWHYYFRLNDHTRSCNALCRRLFSQRSLPGSVRDVPQERRSSAHILRGSWGCDRRNDSAPVAALQQHQNCLQLHGFQPRGSCQTYISFHDRTARLAEIGREKTKLSMRPTICPTRSFCVERARVTAEKFSCVNQTDQTFERLCKFHSNRQFVMCFRASWWVSRASWSTLLTRTKTLFTIQHTLRNWRQERQHE